MANEEVLVVSELVKPPVGDYFTADTFERGLDPWHADAFPAEFKAGKSMEPRRSGWYRIDWCGNVIGWIADGTVVKINKETPIDYEKDSMEEYRTYKSV